VGTSSSRHYFELKSAGTEWFALFDTVVTADDPQVVRPSRHGYLPGSRPAPG
jgi:hypothetical protein